MSDDLRPPCPTCDGRGTIDTRREDRDQGRGEILVTLGVKPCPDCVDGKVSVEQMAATWRAVWDDTLHADDTDWQSVVEELRAVKP